MSIRSYGSLALGALFALGTCWVLFSDLASLSQVTVDHGMTLLVLTGTIASGHLVWPTLVRFRVVPCLGLAVLFLAGTFYCVTTSAARNAEVTAAKAQGVINDNAQRRKLDADIAEAKEDVRKAKLAADTECRSGEGPKCKSTSKLRDQADSHYWLLVGRIANMKAERETDAGTRHAARVFASLPWVSVEPAAIEKALLLFTPFVKALFLEIATLVFMGLGLGHAERGRKAPVPLGSTMKPTVDIETVRAWVREFRSREERNPRINELSAAFPTISKTTAHRRCVEPDRTVPVGPRRPRLKVVRFARQ
jgi:uncharacterized membrane protein